jgi:hypothetical protein
MDMAALPATPDPADSAGQVRVWATAQLMALLDALKPYVNGSFGEVLPQHAQVYVAAIKEINRIWRLAAPVSNSREDVSVPEPAVEAAQMRTRVLGQLAQLADRGPAAGS